METSLLVNVVHNDYKRPNAIFEPFFKAGVDYAARKKPEPARSLQNGHAH